MSIEGAKIVVVGAGLAGLTAAYRLHQAGADVHVYEGPVGYSWTNDPYVRGSYSYIAAGQEDVLTAMSEERGEMVKTLFAPIDQKLYFAGEHTSILTETPGTIEAACESGERTARLLIRSR